MRKADFVLAVAALLAVLTLDTLVALLFAVALSIVRIAIRAARAPVRRLGELPGGAFGDVEAHTDARLHATTLVVRPDELTDDLDVPGAEALLMLAGRLGDAGIPLGLARVHGPVLELLERTAVVAAIGSDHVGRRVEDVVRTFEST